MIARYLFALFFIFYSVLLTSQEVYYDLDIVEENLEEVIFRLEKDHGLLFSYATEDIQNKHVSVLVKQVDLYTLLDSLLAPVYLNYEVTDAKFVLVTAIPENERTRVICGTVIDSLTKEPLPFASVYLEHTNRGVETDQDGKFKLTVETVDSNDLVISYVGYEAKHIQLTEYRDRPCPVIGLTYPKSLEPFVLVIDYLTDGVSLGDNGLSTDIRLESIGTLPGTVGGDVLTLAQFLPGVGSPSSKVSDIYMRGTTPDQTLVSWENIPIYHTGHYFGMISALSSDIIDNMRVYRGGFGAEYGGRIGGMIDLETRAMRDSNELDLGINLTHAFLSGRQVLNTPLKIGISYSVRRSYQDVLNTPLYDKISLVNQQELLLGTKNLTDLPPHISLDKNFGFLDGHLKLALIPSDRDKVAISALGATNFFSDSIMGAPPPGTMRSPEFQFDTMSFENIGINVSWERQWNKKWRSEVDLVGTRYQYDYDFELLRGVRKDTSVFGLRSNRINDEQIKLSATYFTTSNQTIEYGYHLINNDIEYGVVEKCKDCDQDVNDSGRTSGQHHSLYFSFKNPVKNRLGINAGMRLSYFTVDEKVYVEPRMQISYNLSELLYFNSYYGRHNQFVANVSVFKGNDNGINSAQWIMSNGSSEFPVQTADIFQLGLILNKNGWVADIETYYKSVKGLSSRLFDIPKIKDDTPQVGIANIKGLDFLIKKRFRQYRVWLSYSLSSVKVSFDNLPESDFYLDYDQRHVLSAVTQIDVGPFRFSAGVNYASGLPYTRLIEFRETTTPMDNMKTYDLLFGKLNEFRLSSTTEVNLTAEYEYVSKSEKWHIKLAGSIINLLNRDNFFDREYFVRAPNSNSPKIDYIDKMNLGFTPNLSVSISW